MKRYAIAEPGSGLFQGVCLGLCFCWDGTPDSDLPEEEIKIFPTWEEAAKTRDEIVQVARDNGSRSMSIIERWRVVEITESDNLETIARTIASEE